MAVHTVVAILIAVGEVSSPPTQGMTDAMTGAVAEALGPETSLVLRTTRAPSDDEALAIERELGAAAVARVLWARPARAPARGPPVRGGASAVGGGAAPPPPPRPPAPPVRAAPPPSGVFVPP